MKYQIQYRDAGKWYTETATFSSQARAEQAAADWRKAEPNREIRVVEKEAANRPLDKMIRLASKPAPTSSAGRSARAKSIRKYTDAAIAAQVQVIKSNPSPRCGTCGAVVDPFNSDEGYSYCCNDRIEYADEWAAGPSPVLWAAEYVFSKFAIEVGRVPGVMTADLGDYGVQFDVYVDRHNDELERIAARRW